MYSDRSVSFPPYIFFVPSVLCTRGRPSLACVWSVHGCAGPCFKSGISGGRETLVLGVKILCAVTGRVVCTLESRM